MPRKVLIAAILTILIAGAAAIPAHAALITMPPQTKNINLVSTDGSPVTQVLDFLEFDPSLGTLISMTMSWKGVADMQGDVDVQQPEGRDFGQYWKRVLYLDLSGPPFTLTNIPVASGMPGCDVNAASGATSCGGQYTLTQSASGHPAPSPWQIGTGSFSMTLQLSNGISVFSASNVSSASYTPTLDRFAGTMSVTYQYETPGDAPEPGTLALFGAGVAVFAVWKRRN
jgi:hypothetical protein